MQAGKQVRLARLRGWQRIVPLCLGLTLVASAESQIIRFKAQEADIVGVKLRHIEGELRARSMDATDPPEEITAALSLQIHDRWISQREITARFAAQIDRHNWHLRLMPLELSMSLDPEQPQSQFNVSSEIFGKQSMLPEQILLRLNLADLNYTNASGTFAAEDVQLESVLRWRPLWPETAPKNDDGSFEIQIQSSRGAALLGASLLDFAAHPLRLQLSGKLESLWPLNLALNAAEINQPHLLSAKATTQTRIRWPIIGDTPSPKVMTVGGVELEIETATVELASLQFPAAYQSYLRTALAGTLLGNLRTTGEITGLAIFDHTKPTYARLSVQDVSAVDQRAGAVNIENLSGELYWHSDLTAKPKISHLGWSSAALNGIPANAATLNFLWQADQLQLIEPALIPILDGALRIDAFSALNLFSIAPEVSFDGSLDPISLSSLTNALGWPPLGGTLTGRAPGVRYRDGRLALSGALEAEVFGGLIAGRNLKIDQPFSRWPRLTVDMDLTNLDLALLTSTFDIGAMTGRIGGQILDLELFGWRPVSFDASLATVETSPEPRRISVRAINSIANLGGTAGGGVAAALQGGLLRFFDSYRYRRLGLRCVLRDDVCLMSGTAPDAQRFGDRYTLLEGEGIPRLDIVGYTGRVKWSQLVEQISAQIQSGAVPVRAP